MSVLAHREDGCGWCPRHPLVCLLDLLGVVMAVTSFVYRPTLTLLLLPLCVAAQYTISCIYHWLPFSKVRQTLDHLMIAALISGTYIHYWANTLPYTEAKSRIWILFVLVVLVVIVKFALPQQHKLLYTLDLTIGFCGLGISLATPAMLSIAAWTGFLSGICLYFVQFLVFALEKPDPYPELFGFREIQHFVLLCASGMHLFVSVAYF